MFRKYKKKASLITSLILCIIFFTSLFVIYGLIKYMFVFNTTFGVHFLFIGSGIFFFFSAIIFILEILEEEGVEYIVSDDRILIKRLFNISVLKWGEIRKFYSYTVKIGNADKKIYVIGDEEEPRLTFGEEIYNSKELVGDIIERSGIEIEEKPVPEGKTPEEFYHFLTFAGKEKISHSLGVKIHNGLNSLILLFFLVGIFFLEERWTARSEEIKKVFFSLQVIMVLLLVVCVTNLIFQTFFLNLKRKASLILILLINCVVTLFFLSAAFVYSSSYKAFHPILTDFSVAAIIISVVFFFLSLGYIRTVLWAIKNIK